MTEIDIIDLDASDAAQVDQFFDVLDASFRETLPGFPLLARPVEILRFLRRSPEMTIHRRLAVVGGRVVGVAQAMLFLLENTHLAEIELDVHPDWRRRGVAAALYADIERIAREDGRRTLHIYVPTPVEGGQPREDYPLRVAERFGFTPDLAEIRRVCDLSDPKQSDLDELLAASWAKAEGFELRHWVDIVPEDLVAGVAYLDGRLLQDAPTGTLDMEPQKVDVDRIRGRERDRRSSGQIRLGTALVHSETGRVAGFSDIVVNAGDEENCWQGITIVDPDFRGHRIGTILKIENHRHVLRYRPMMRYVHTWNAAVNAHMISINEAVGYRVADGWTAYEKKLDD